MSAFGWLFFWFLFVHFAQCCQCMLFKICSETEFLCSPYLYGWLPFLEWKGEGLGAVQNKTYWKVKARSLKFALYLLLSCVFRNPLPHWVFSCLGWVISKLMALHNLCCAFLSSWFRKLTRLWQVVFFQHRFMAAMLAMYLHFFACCSSCFLPTKGTPVAVMLEFTYLIYTNPMKYFYYCKVYMVVWALFLLPTSKGNPCLLPRQLFLISL